MSFSQMSDQELQQSFLEVCANLEEENMLLEAFTEHIKAMRIEIAALQQQLAEDDETSSEELHQMQLKFNQLCDDDRLLYALAQAKGSVMDTMMQHSDELNQELEGRPALYSATHALLNQHEIKPTTVANVDTDSLKTAVANMSNEELQTHASILARTLVVVGLESAALNAHVARWAAKVKAGQELIGVPIRVRIGVVVDIEQMEQIQAQAAIDHAARLQRNIRQLDIVKKLADEKQDSIVALEQELAVYAS